MEELRPYHAVRKRLVIPPALQSEVLERIPTIANKCQEKADISVWWPGISTDI